SGKESSRAGCITSTRGWGWTSRSCGANISFAKPWNGCYGERDPRRVPSAEERAWTRITRTMWSSRGDGIGEPTRRPEPDQCRICPRVPLQRRQSFRLAELHGYGTIQGSRGRLRREGIGMKFAAFLLLTLPLVQAQGRIDAVFRRFWAADNPAAAARAADEVVNSGVTFGEALRRLQQGRAYTEQKAGVIQLSNRTSDGIEHFYAVTIPPGYDPARRYQVRVQLHGGVGGRSDNRPRGNGQIGNLAGAEQIYVIPYAWSDEPWWSDDQVLNLRTIVDALKRRYNIDENRVVVAGVSDGGTGAYYIAMRDTTPYASFLPLNGFLMVLANGEIDDGRNFPNNLRNKPLFVINGGKDRLYPIRIVEPYTRHLMAHGVQIEYHPQPDGEHNTAWWPQMMDPFEIFVSEHPRDPDPDKLSWEAADAQHNRAHWLVIDSFGMAPGEPKELSDLNIF